METEELTAGDATVVASKTAGYARLIAVYLGKPYRDTDGPSGHYYKDERLEIDSNDWGGYALSVSIRRGTERVTVYEARSLAGPYIFKPGLWIREVERLGAEAEAVREAEVAAKAEKARTEKARRFDPVDDAGVFPEFAIT